MIAGVDELLSGRLDDGELREGFISGAVILFAHRGEVIHHAAYGDAVRYADATGTPGVDQVPMRQDTIFDVASLTKLFTAAAALRAVEEGFVGLDRPVADHIRGFQPGVTLGHLLTHQSGLPAVRQLWTVPGDRHDRSEAVLRTASEAGPGERHVYSCVGYLVTGVLLERVLGLPLPSLVEKFVAEPLGLADTGYQPGAELRSRTAATEDEANVGRGMVHGEVHDEASWSLDGMGGNAGVFSTAADLLRFAEMLRGGGVEPGSGVRVLSEASIAAMTTDQLPPGMADTVGYGQGVGPRIADRTFMGTVVSERAFGHTGFTGTSLVVDPDRDLVVIVLANAVHPVRGRTVMGDLRNAVADRAASFVTS